MRELFMPLLLLELATHAHAIPKAAAHWLGAQGCTLHHAIVDWRRRHSLLMLTVGVSHKVILALGGHLLL